METTVIIAKRGDEYISTVSGRFGGGHSNMPIGKTPEEAAVIATRLMIEYSLNNPDGGQLITLPEIKVLVPQHLHKIEAVRNEKI